MSNELYLCIFGDKIADGKVSIDEINLSINALLPIAVNCVNFLFSPHQLIKRGKTAESLPMKKDSYLLIENGLGQCWNML